MCMKVGTRHRGLRNPEPAGQKPPPSPRPLNWLLERHRRALPPRRQVPPVPPLLHDRPHRVPRQPLLLQQRVDERVQRGAVAGDEGLDLWEVRVVLRGGKEGR
jgi:hypothetical protein